MLFLIPNMLNAGLVLLERSRLGQSRLGREAARSALPHAYTLLFAVAMGVVMHAHEREPDSLTTLMRGLLRFFVGKPQVETNERKKEKGNGKIKTSGK